MPSFSRDPLPVDAGHLRTTAVAHTDLLDGFGKNQFPKWTGRSPRNPPPASMGRERASTTARYRPCSRRWREIPCFSLLPFANRERDISKIGNCSSGASARLRKSSRDTFSTSLQSSLSAGYRAETGLPLTVPTSSLPVTKRWKTSLPHIEPLKAFALC